MSRTGGRGDDGINAGREERQGERNKEGYRGTVMKERHSGGTEFPRTAEGRNEGDRRTGRRSRMKTGP